PIVLEVIQHCREELIRQPVRFGVVAVAAQALNSEQLDGSPAIRIVPLHAGILRAHSETARMLKRRNILCYGCGLLGCRKACPQRIVRSQIAISGLLAERKVIVEEKPAFTVPQILLNPAQSSRGT